ncbi:MAG: hypothetical protein NXI04_15905 [Planctomycetaceae bacterium]|nr:hypothetical protein [Planctomycetaceae bacterium]
MRELVYGSGGKALQADVKNFNSDLTAHNAAFSELNGTPVVGDGVTAADIQSSRLQTMQSKLDGLRKAVELAERSRDLLDRLVEAANNDWESTKKAAPKAREAVEKKLDEIGITIAAMPAHGRNPRAAETQWYHFLRHAPDFRQAEDAVPAARQRHQELVSQRQKADDIVDAARATLRVYSSDLATV